MLATVGEVVQRPVLQLVPELARLLPPTGARRGSTIAVTGSTSLLLALLAGPSAGGAWCAIVGMPGLGTAAAAEAGIAVDRLALVPSPGRQWAETVAALIDGVDVVAACPPARLAAGMARRLASRARERGAVLVPVGAWEGAELTLTATGADWAGLSWGAGRLRSRRLDVRVTGRGVAARPRIGVVWWPPPPAEPMPAEPIPALPALEAVG